MRAQLVFNILLYMTLCRGSEARLTVVEGVFAYVAGLVSYGVDVRQNSLAQAIGCLDIAKHRLPISELHHLLQVALQEDRRLTFVSDLVHLAATGRLRCGIS